MTKRPLRVLQVNTRAIGGGAESVAVVLHDGLKSRGLDSYLAVGRSEVDNPDVLVIPTSIMAKNWERLLRTVVRAADPLVDTIPTMQRVQRFLHRCEKPRLMIDWYRGREHFHYPGTAALPDLPAKRPDIIHCHNLHGDYFDLGVLPKMTQRFPVAMTLHDEWTFTGHCAYTLGCDRWRSGCGACPDLTRYPAIRRDATATNWHAKLKIFANSRLYISTPSYWLMERAKESLLFKGCAGARVIPNGVDTDVFCPSTEAKTALRARLGLPVDGPLLLALANSIRVNPYKDYPMIAGAMNLLSKCFSNATLVVVGSSVDGKTKSARNNVFVSYRENRHELADYYRAADIFLHAAKTETWGLTATEAMACGTPVVATGIEGLREQIRGLKCPPSVGETWPAEAATGILVGRSDSEAMAAATNLLLSDTELAARLGRNAAEHVRNEFTIQNQIENTIDWYEQILDDWSSLCRAV